MAALAGAHEDLCVVDEHGVFPVRDTRRLESAGGLGGTLDRFVLGNGRIRWNDVDSSPTEADGSLNQCEERVVLAATNLVAGLEVRATLANDDGSGLGGLTSVQLHSAKLRVGVATVLGGPLSLLMCHVSHS